MRLRVGFMSQEQYRNNHYVPKWYQRLFIPSMGQAKYHYLDLISKKIDCGNGKMLSKENVRSWGADSCFKEKDLYTTFFGDLLSVEIEKFFFGKIDARSREALDYFANFKHPHANGEAFKVIMNYMSTQKLRTPKGLLLFKDLIKSQDHNQTLYWLQKYQNLHCATWSESIWQVASAENSQVKFIISDHPVTVYNRKANPESHFCTGYNDPDIRFSGTHTLFPLSEDKILIITNRSLLRNPNGNPLEMRPNPAYLRDTFFNFQEIQTDRMLTEYEVLEINYIIKKRAFRYIAAREKEWLYPERQIKMGWFNLGSGYLLIPDPRSLVLSFSAMMSFSSGRVMGFDEFGRTPNMEDYSEGKMSRVENERFERFKGEFAKKFGPKRRGRTFSFGKIDEEFDSDDYHKYHLSLFKKK